MAASQRRIVVATEMRALAHPLRLRLLELMAAEGAFTASEAARRLDQTPANVSWHLRTLATYGFVRQGQGPGRARPWKLVSQSLTFGHDAEDPAVATALSDLVLEREFQVLRAGLRQQPSEDEEWREASSLTQARLWLTSEEARRLGERLKGVISAAELVDRSQDPEQRPPGARLMALMGWLVPSGSAPARVEPSGEHETPA